MIRINQSNFFFIIVGLNTFVKTCVYEHFRFARRLMNVQKVISISFSCFSVEQ